MSEKIKIILADDHRIFRESLQLLISQTDNIEVVGQAEDGIGVAKLVKEVNVDMILMDISMPKKNGLEAAKELAISNPNIGIIFLTMHKSEDMMMDAFLAGAKGYLLKENAFEELVTAINYVASGKVYVSSVFDNFMVNNLIQAKKGSTNLSGREREILKLLAEGYSNKEISTILIISIKTVETHRANIMKKHNFKNITELVLYAARNHIIEI